MTNLKSTQRPTEIMIVVQLTMSMVRPRKYMNLKLHMIKVCPKLNSFWAIWLTHPPTKVSVSRQQSITMTAVTKLLIMMTVTQKMHPAAVPTPMNISLAMIASVSQLPYFLYQIAFVSLFQHLVAFFSGK